MRRTRVAIAACVVAAFTVIAAQTPAKPRVVVLIVIDQMRADYFQRYQFTDGFKRVWDSGAVFTEARYPYASNKTAEAHALMLSGWSPSGTGLVSDRWYDRASGAMISAGASAEHKLLGSNGEGGSPEQLLVHTVGDALKEAHPRSMVLTASWKKYTAVLNGGHHPDLAFWMDETTGHFATSDYYAKSYPAWTGVFTRDDLTLPYFGTTWQGHKLGTGSAPDEAFRTRVRYSPAGNTILLAFAKTLVEQSGIGADDEPDLVAISFSSVDYVGHDYGPETPEFDETILKMDHDLGDLLRTLDAKIGAANYTVALTADHGAPLVPERQLARGIEAGKMTIGEFRNVLERTVPRKLGITGPVIAAWEPPELWLDYATASKQGISRQALDRAVVEAAQAHRGVARAYTVDDVMSAAGSNDPLLQAVAEGYYPARSGDIHVLVKPNYIFWNAAGVQHGTPYDYDAHVPLIFMGAGVKPGKYDQRVRINELAPTIGQLLGVPFKGDSQGRVLTEALRP